MDLPLCKICGDRHRLGGCPKFEVTRDLRLSWMKGMVSGAPKTATPAKADQHRQAQGSPQAQQEAPEIADGQANKNDAGQAQEERPGATAPNQGRQATGQLEGIEAGQLPAPLKPKFDKNAYQRELMRKRRADAKLKAPR